jgi:hypothetical protein
MMFTEQELTLIESLSEGMSQQEVLDYFGLVYADLDDEKKQVFDKTWRKGKVNIKHFALTKLKEQMSGRNGMQASLAALSQFGEEWVKAEGVANVKSFKITLDD